MPRMNVLLLAIDRLFKPWCEDVMLIVSARHDIRVFDESGSLTEQFAGMDVVIDHGGHVGTHEMMDAAAGGVSGEGARLWQIMSIGYEHVDIPYLLSKVPVAAFVPGTTSAASLAETAVMLMLMLAHRARQRDAAFREGKWLEPAGDELEGKTLGVVGLGHSGRRMAALGKALGMRVAAANRSPAAAEGLVLDQFYPLEQLDELISESDFISLHVAATPQTTNLIDARRIALMKPTAQLINTARGAIIEQDALFDALIGGRIGGAGLDVFTQEPPDRHHPVFDLPNLVVTPHVAAFTDGSSRKRAQFMADNIDRVAKGKKPLCRIRG